MVVQRQTKAIAPPGKQPGGGHHCAAPEDAAFGPSGSIPVMGKALKTSFPLPVGIHAWDWPLSRDEKKMLVLMFDRQELVVQRDEFADQLSRLDDCC